METKSLLYVDVNDHNDNSRLSVLIIFSLLSTVPGTFYLLSLNITNTSQFFVK